MGILTGGNGLWFISCDVGFGWHVCCTSLVIAVKFCESYVSKQVSKQGA